MGLIVAILGLGVALAALLLTPANEPILGLGHSQFAGAAIGGAMLVAIALGGGLLNLIRALVSAFVWVALAVGLWFGYANRERLADFTLAALDSLSDPEPQIGSGGEVTIRRALGGAFWVPGQVNDRPVKFVFDTGASTVVLTAEDAVRIGLDLKRLDFSGQVVTANGLAHAAVTKLAKISVGPITVRNVRALVTQPGATPESLLGMSFLEELQSYKVEKGKLTLTARKTGG